MLGAEPKTHGLTLPQHLLDKWEWRVLKFVLNKAFQIIFSLVAYSEYCHLEKV